MTNDRPSRRQKAPHGQRNDAARMRFASWLVMPPSQRQPKTQDELAKDLGIAASTLSAWRRLPLIQAVTKDWRDAYAAHFSEVVDALMRQARRGNVPAARLLAEILGQLAPTRVEQKIDGSPWGELLQEIRDGRAGDGSLKVLDGGKGKKRAAS